EDLVEAPERRAALGRRGAGPDLFAVRLDVEVEPREAGQALRAPRRVVRDDAPDALGRARRIAGPAGILEEHGLHREPEASAGPVEELAEPRPIGLVHEEARTVLDAEIEAVGEGGEPGELGVP